MSFVATCHRRPGTLHRAFSVLVVDMDGYICMQQRAGCKPTFPLCWSNTVCSHPRDRTLLTEEWVRRRCNEEIGLDILPSLMKCIGRLHYRARTGEEWEEHEMDWVYHVELDVPHTEIHLTLNPDEIAAVKWVGPSELRRWMVDDRVHISPWFRAIWREFYTTSDRWPTPVTREIVRVENLDEVSHASVESDHAILTPYSYVSGMNGKQIRPLLTKAAASILGLNEHQERIIALTIQGIHDASLVADDIEDVSTTRRGAPCAHHVFGTALSINAPYFAMFKILQRLGDEPPSVQRQTVDALVELHRGQGTDIQWCALEHCPTQEEYLRMIAGKTGALFRLIATLGCTYAGKKENSELVSLYAEMAEYFQIRDDYCNICDPESWERKGFFEDLDEGKMSYTVIHSFENGTAEDCASMRRLLRMRGKATETDKYKAYELLKRSHSLAYTYDYLQRTRARLVQQCAENSILNKVMERLPIMEPPILDRTQST